jgi:hypothetical protein
MPGADGNLPACTELADTSICIVAGWLPSFGIGLAVDKLQVTCALSVAVSLSPVSANAFLAMGSKWLTGPVLSTRRALALLGHGDKVQGSVETARELR